MDRIDRVNVKRKKSAKFYGKNHIKWANDWKYTGNSLWYTG